MVDVNSKGATGKYGKREQRKRKTESYLCIIPRANRFLLYTLISQGIGATFTELTFDTHAVAQQIAHFTSAQYEPGHH